MGNKTNTQNITLGEILRPLAQLLLRFSGPDQRLWLAAFKRFLRKEHPWLSTKWEIWRVYKVGLKKPLSELITAITDQGFKTYYTENDELDLLTLEQDIRFNETEEDAYFALVSAKELGLKKGWTRRQFLDAALKHDLILPLSGDILEILAQGKYLPTEKDTTLELGMEPIKIRSGLGYFVVGYYKEAKYLGYHNGDLAQKFDQDCHLDKKYLFRIRNKFNC